MNELLSDLRHAPPVHLLRLPQAAALNARLQAAFQREKTTKRARFSHHFHGRFENTYIDRAAIPELQTVSDLATAAARQITGRETLRFGFWFNEMGPGHRTSLHAHEEDDELLSCVYYIDCPPDSGRLLVHDDDAVRAIEPEAGLLVLFAPDLPHEVEVNASRETRLSVAFNFGPA